MPESTTAVKQVTFIVPFYNESQALNESYVGLEEKLASAPFEVELLLIDDGSTDGLELQPGVEWARVIRHPHNMGNGAAVKTGIRAAKYDHCVVVDADGQHQLEDAFRLVEQLKDYHLVVGARNFSNSGNAHRSLANRIYSRFASFMANFPIEDLTSGMRAFRKAQALELIHLYPNGFSLPSTMTLGLIKLGYLVKFIPIDVKVREGKSKLNIVSDGLRFFLIIMKIATLFSPMRLFFPLSACIFLAGLINYVTIFFWANRFSQWSIVLLTNSITIFMMGLVAEEISSLKLKKER